MNQAPTCRRCSECANSRHHWIECCEAVETGEAGEVIFDRICKHCECLGTVCEECETRGVVDIGCANCEGYGVVESCMYGRNEE